MGGDGRADGGAAEREERESRPSAYWAKQTDGSAVVADDPYLEPFQDELRNRYKRFVELKTVIEAREGGLDAFSQGYKRFGFGLAPDGIRYREWAPAAAAVYLTGDFNGWDRRSHPLERDAFGCWSIFLPHRPSAAAPGGALEPAIAHGSKLKLVVVTPGGLSLDRNPAWARYVVQNPDTFLFDTVFWNPPGEWTHHWRHAAHVPAPQCLRIYECHIGMATDELRVGTYTEFRDKVLPRVKRLGYNAIQVMAVMEHAYYASFGYHVTNFFACSSRCGTPEDLKAMIDAAHGMGIHVLMDVVHSHASSNAMDGISQFDGSDNQYFHAGERGHHRQWDSRCFDYSRWEVMRFLLSNLRWWMDEYRFDGFRFDGVTSMLYTHHGVGAGFSGQYHEYFGVHVDMDACVYLMLANDMLHALYPGVAVTIAEDVSGMPVLCRPVGEGGLGFDYRLAMAVPDKWIELLQTRDEEWDVGGIVHALVNRRRVEKSVAYVESHDQALVGDKTTAFWLMDKDMYDSMAVSSPPNERIERGFALHKMLRLITYGLGGEAYLNFMGNEFGHPEWIDFPREGNGFSYAHARRLWYLADSDYLRYQYLQRFDANMHALETRYPFCRAGNHLWVVVAHADDHVVAFERGERLLFVFNLHPTQSYSGYRVGVWWPGKYRAVLDTDSWDTNGQGRVHWDVVHETRAERWHGRPYHLQLYVPCRTAQVYHCFEEGARCDEIVAEKREAKEQQQEEEEEPEVEA